MQYEKLYNILKNNKKWIPRVRKMTPSRVQWVDAYWASTLSGRWFMAFCYQIFGWVKQDEIQDYVERTIDRLRSAQIKQNHIQPGEEAILTTIAQGKMTPFATFISQNLLAVYAAFQQVNFFPNQWWNTINRKLESLTEWLNEHPLTFKPEYTKSGISIDNKTITYEVIDEKIDQYEDLDWFQYSEIQTFKNTCDFDFDKFHDARNVSLMTQDKQHWEKVQTLSVNEIGQLDLDDRALLVQSFVKDFEEQCAENFAALKEIKSTYEQYHVVLKYEEYANNACQILKKLTEVLEQGALDKPVEAINHRIQLFKKQFQTNNPYLQKLFNDFNQTLGKIKTVYYTLPEEIPEEKQEKDLSRPALLYLRNAGRFNQNTHTSKPGQVENRRASCSF